MRSECWGLQGSSRQTAPPQGSAGALNSHPTTVPASFLTEARSWGGASSGWESGDLRAGLSPAIPLAKLLLAHFPNSYLKGTSVSLLSWSSILQIKRGSLTHYSPIVSLLPTVLWAMPSSAVLPLSKAIISSQLLKIPQVPSSPGSCLLRSSSTCPGQPLGPT